VQSLVWVPAHRGIWGNEMADKAATEVCSSTSEDKSTAISENYFWSLVKEENEGSWKTHYSNNIKHNSLYHLLQSAIRQRLWYSLTDFDDKKFTLTM